jgi:hypothetical protein
LWETHGRSNSNSNAWSGRCDAWHMFTILYSCFPVFNFWEFGGGRGDGLMVMWWWNCDNGGWREIWKGLIRHDKTLVRFGGPCVHFCSCVLFSFSLSMDPDPGKFDLHLHRTAREP